MCNKKTPEISSFLLQTKITEIFFFLRKNLPATQAKRLHSANEKSHNPIRTIASIYCQIYKQKKIKHISFSFWIKKKRWI